MIARVLPNACKYVRPAAIKINVAMLGNRPTMNRKTSRAVSASMPIRFVENAAYASGQLSSLVTGLRLIDRPGVVAALIALVDVPFVSTETVRAVLERHRRTHAAIVRPTAQGRHGHPMLVDRSLFDE